MQTSPVRDELLNRATDLKVIPTLSNVMERVLHVMEDKDSSFVDLSNVIKHDQAISSKVISIANSAYYSRGIEIFNMERAMISIGFDEVKSIVMCILFIDTILKKLKLKEEDLVALWKHSIHVACAAKVLAEKTFADEPQKVYTISLLHDIGKVIFYMGADGYVQMVREAEMIGKDLVALERDRFGIDHQEIGYVIALKWKFPDEFTNAIRYHHENQQAGRDEALMNLIRCADRFSTMPQTLTGPEGYILTKTKDVVAREMQKIMDFLNLK
jgi:putative nucleotidyltransferase with HDIG domain